MAETAFERDIPNLNVLSVTEQASRHIRQYDMLESCKKAHDRHLKDAYKDYIRDKATQISELLDSVAEYSCSASSVLAMFRSLQCRDDRVYKHLVAGWHFHERSRRDEQAVKVDQQVARLRAEVKAMTTCK
jgi:hypothetical protein